MHEYETIKHARAVLAAIGDTRPSERTIATYRARTQRLLKLAKAEEGPELARLIACTRATKSASTWFGRRAALMYTFRIAIEKRLQEQDRLQRGLKADQVPADSSKWEAWCAAVASLARAVDWHEAIRNEQGPPPAERKRRHSKRKDLHGLPEDWRERVVARIPNYRAAVLAAAVTGCRPAELVAGVRLSIEGGMLVAHIHGAKVTAKSGQPWRRLSWPVGSESPLVAMLVAEVRNGLDVAKIDDAKRYSGAVRAAGEREWPRRKAKLSPYCFRHAATSDMKAGAMEDSSISQALGHCVDVARSYYGQRQQGNGVGGVAPKSVIAARPVRISVQPRFGKGVLWPSSNSKSI